MKKPIDSKKTINCFTAMLLLLATSLLLSCSKSENTGSENTSNLERSKPSELWARPVLPETGSAEVEAKVEEIFLQMSLEEKVGQIIQAEIQTITPEDIKKYHIGSVLNGGGSIPYRIKNATQEDWLRLADEFFEASMDTSDGKLAIPVIWGTDAVHGHGNVTGATLFPHNIGLGAANNPELIRKIGEVTAREVRATGIEWIFAPTIAVAQNDRWGRTYESYSEKPDIVRVYTKFMVEGMQGTPGSEEFLDEKHVAATAKHFVGDGGTEDGDDQGNTVVSEEELYSIHAAGYEAALEAGVQSVMASFNAWNGTKVHGNEYLMTQVLKGKLGFDGFIVGDWNGHGQIPGCTNASCWQSLAAGLDMYMVPYDWKALYENLLVQLNNGMFGIGRLNDAVKRILRVKVMLGLFDAPKPSERYYGLTRNFIGNAGHRAIARQAVRESLVLLKNKNDILPLSPKLNILVAGDAADDIGKQSGGWSINWQGVTKGNENFPGATSIFAGIKERVEAAGGTAALSVNGEYSQKPDVAIVVFGENPYAEGVGDINTLEYQPGNKIDLALLKKLKEAGIPVVSVFVSGRPLWVNPEINASDAFVAAWLPGSEGTGVAEVLIQKANGETEFDFKGRLSFSWPKLPTQAKLNQGDENYDPLFAYGYGLDYASGKQGPGKLVEDVPGLMSSTGGDIDFYVGKPIEPWRIIVRNSKGRQALSGSYAELNDGDVKVRTFDKDVQEDALHFTFKNTPQASIGLEDGPTVNLSHIAKADGVLSFDIQNIKQLGAQVELVMQCGFNCERKVPISAFMASIVDKGWQNLQVKLSCFAEEGDTFEAISQPFIIRGSGSGEIGIANVRLLMASNSADECPN